MYTPIRKPTQNKGAQTPFFEFLKQYWYVLIALIFAVPYIARYIRSQGLKDLEQEAEIQAKENLVKNTNPTNETENRNKITDDKKLHQISHNIAHYLGFIYAWYDPRSWTEDDELCFKEFQKLTISGLEKVKKLYFEVDAPGRNLQDDCRKVLDEKYYNRIKW